MDHSEKWAAVVQCNAAYDGLFFYGVRTTGIFCRPSCKSKIPLQDNVMFFDKSEEAMKSGYRPCKRCRPDLSVYFPMAQSLEKAKTMIDTDFADGEVLAAQMKQLGISQNYLVRLFRQKFGLSPLEYRNKLRIEKSKKLLHSTNANILHVAMACGFKSLSAFYEIFNKQVGSTPKEYRKNSCDKKTKYSDIYETTK